ncbi:hypothetical protein FRB91_003998 [Serendipita sp. 411]|nr:hypothetical protein FRB91_003998 [Serendipita sp. 411]
MAEKIDYQTNFQIYMQKNPGSRQTVSPSVASESFRNGGEGQTLMLHSRSALRLVETPARMPNATSISNLKAQGAPNLVDDVLEIILDHLYSFGNFRLRPDRRSFARYALISRAWRIPTQTLLFREVWIRKTSQLESLKRALLPKTRHAKLLAHTIRVLWIRIDGLERVGTLDPDRLPECMKLCPRLYELRLETFAVKRLSEGTLRSLEMTPPIYALQLIRPEMPYWERYEYTELHLQLLQVSHWRLQFFTMEGKYDAAWPPRRLLPVKHQFIEVRFRASTGLRQVRLQTFSKPSHVRDSLHRRERDIPAIQSTQGGRAHVDRNASICAPFTPLYSETASPPSSHPSRSQR